MTPCISVYETHVNAFCVFCAATRWEHVVLGEHKDSVVPLQEHRPYAHHQRDLRNGILGRPLLDASSKARPCCKGVPERCIEPRPH